MTHQSLAGWKGVEITRQQWCMVMPIKRFTSAKTRLAALAGQHRMDLALAFALDTAKAALACDVVLAVIVVTDEPRAARALTGIGAVVIEDKPTAGLNPALSHGADVAVDVYPDAAICALLADLPALRPNELKTALAAAAGVRTAFVSDAAGSGTTALLARHRRDFSPAFGPGSAAAHLSSGAVEIRGNTFPSLRCDVDTPSEFAFALDMGVGLHTAAVARRLSPVGFQHDDINSCLARQIRSTGNSRK
jgi:2-phospho-L-lactate/phosphoenolpyruvate guanylyltransferase